MQERRKEPVEEGRAGFQQEAPLPPHPEENVRMAEDADPVLWGPPQLPPLPRLPVSVPQTGSVPDTERPNLENVR